MHVAFAHLKIHFKPFSVRMRTRGTQQAQPLCGNYEIKIKQYSYTHSAPQPKVIRSVQLMEFSKQAISQLDDEKHCLFSN